MVPPILVIVFKAVTLVLGGLVTYFALKAYRRTKSSALGALALGFGIVTVGSLLAGIVDQVLLFQRNGALVIESVLTAIGFAIILYSLYIE